MKSSRKGVKDPQKNNNAESDFIGVFYCLKVTVHPLKVFQYRCMYHNAFPGRYEGYRFVFNLTEVTFVVYVQVF